MDRPGFLPPAVRRPRPVRNIGTSGNRSTTLPSVPACDFAALITSKNTLFFAIRQLRLSVFRAAGKLFLETSRFRPISADLRASKKIPDRGSGIRARSTGFYAACTCAGRSRTGSPEPCAAGVRRRAQSDRTSKTILYKSRPAECRARLASVHRGHQRSDTEAPSCGHSIFTSSI